MSRTNDQLHAEAIAELADLERGINRLQREIRRQIQGQLSSLTGRSLGELQLNRQLVQRVHRLLDSHGLRIRCGECGHEDLDSWKGALPEKAAYRWTAVDGDG